MAVSSAQVAVGATPTSLGVTDGGQVGVRILLRNTGATDVFLGGSAVTTAIGYNLASGTSLALSDLNADDAVFAIAAVSGTVHVLRTGV